MPIYTCPECQTKLKKSQPVEAGKRLRCPEGQNVFAPKTEKGPAPKASKPAKAPPPVPVPPGADDDDGPALYGVITEVENEEAAQNRQQAFDPLKERFEKSKRGPALERVIKPANYMLLSGVLTCLMSAAGTLVAIFPLVFQFQDVSVKSELYARPGEGKTKYISFSPETKEQCYWAIAGCSFLFLWGGGV